MARTTSPAVNYASKGAVGCNGILLDIDQGIWMFTAPGALTNGTSGDGAGWANKGSVAIRLDTGNWYRNTNTKASPTWVEMSTA